MSKLKYLNLGCGSRFHEDWINIDFSSNSDLVIAHNLLNGIPAETKSIDVVYHSHVLEHFSKEDAKKFIGECYRVLKPNGIIRIAIPDLEQIISNYQQIIKELTIRPEDEKLWADYDWTLLEMYDQTVRNKSGGDMAGHLCSGNLRNKDFIIERCGDEVKNIINSTTNPFGFKHNKEKKSILKEVYRIIRYSGRRERAIRLLLGEEYQLLNVGRFRFGGEIHQWMYDRFSLNRLLSQSGFERFEVKSAFDSNIENWANYMLDGKDGVVRKPDSLFVEAIKPL